MNTQDLIKANSGIMIWNTDNIDKASESFGVFVLRESPINGHIIEIDKTDNIRSRLNEIYNTNNEKIKYFSWFATKDDSDAETLLSYLKKDYSF